MKKIIIKEVRKESKGLWVIEKENSSIVHVKPSITKAGDKNTSFDLLLYLYNNRLSDGNIIFNNQGRLNTTYIYKYYIYLLEKNIDQIRKECFFNNTDNTYGIYQSAEYIVIDSINKDYKVDRDRVNDIFDSYTDEQQEVVLKYSNILLDIYNSFYEDIKNNTISYKTNIGVISLIEKMPVTNKKPEDVFIDMDFLNNIGEVYSDEDELDEHDADIIYYNTGLIAYEKAMFPGLENVITKVEKSISDMKIIKNNVVSLLIDSEIDISKLTLNIKDVLDILSLDNFNNVNVITLVKEDEFKHLFMR